MQVAKINKQFAKDEKIAKKKNQRIYENYYSAIKKMGNDKEKIKIFLQEEEANKGSLIRILMENTPNESRQVFEKHYNKKYGIINTYFMINNQLYTESKKKLKNILPAVIIVSVLIILLLLTPALNRCGGSRMRRETRSRTFLALTTERTNRKLGSAAVSGTRPPTTGIFIIPSKEARRLS
ncbi:MAG: hypothetical protein LBH44_04915 [Treponema sp.]|jgi:hypothetical protein|nr:hypothetical protein [Treponema sp.]